MIAGYPIEILFVDFNEAHCRILGEALESLRSLEYRLQIAHTGRDALDRLFKVAPFEAAPRPDLVLLDLDLPLVPGLDVVKLVKADPLLRTIPVVVFTRDASAETIGECYRRGANSVVVRPVPLGELAETIRLVLKYWTGTSTLPPSTIPFGWRGRV